jgi:hypothetical protein
VPRFDDSSLDLLRRKLASHVAIEIKAPEL